MENFSINVKDIQKYINTHRELVLNKEPLFVKYMKETSVITIEKLDMLLDTYNWQGITKDEDEIKTLLGLENFASYLKREKIETLRELQHIIIPAVGFYQKNRNLSYQNLKEVAMKVRRALGEEFTFNGIDTGELSYALKNFQIAGQIEKYDKDYSILKIGQRKCQKELIECGNVYGKKTVQKIRRLVKKEIENN